ncbi:MAG: hypothetical protein DRJ97_00800 [Thermoprotei archaeon]|nr:MAG: hypothetical protein DRJ97_00800 [Thermoprotei archaeon]
MRFERWVRETCILNPLKGFELEVQELEHRLDPLTGLSTIVARGRLPYVKPFMEHDEQLLRRLAEATRQNCPFCPGKVEEVTPKFPLNVVAEGRIKVGSCVAFPSLHAHSDFNAVVVLGREHFVKPSEFTNEVIAEGLKASLEVLRRVYKFNPTLKYASVIMNYLPPAGSSIVHPHMQVLASTEAFNYLRELLEYSFRYYATYSSCFWEELVKVERELGERYVASIGGVHWLVPFAPQRQHEVWAIVEGTSDLLSLSDEDLKGLSRGLVNVLSFYEREGLLSFNFAIYSAPLDSKAEYFRLLLRMCSRFGLKEPFLNDYWAMPALLGENEIVEAPEDYAARLRASWR